MANNNTRHLDWDELCACISQGRTLAEYGADCTIYRQGQPADSLLHIRRGKVKLSVTSKHGREGTVATMGAGELFGEGCLAGQRLRTATATAMTDCTLLRIKKRAMMRLLHERQEISRLFVAHLLSRNIRYESALVDQLFNSSEKRLARILLMLSHFGEESTAGPVQPRVSQAGLAQMVGTTRSRISRLMNKFKELGLIDCGDRGGLTVHSGLLGVVLRD